MVTKDPVKNRAYVKKSNEKKKLALGQEKYNEYFAQNERKSRENIKNKIGVDEYKRKQAEYMVQYRLKIKNTKAKKDKKEVAMNTLTNAIRMKKARQELLNRAIEKANKTAVELTNIYSNTQKEAQNWANKHQPKRGRPSLK